MSAHFAANRAAVQSFVLRAIAQKATGLAAKVAGEFRVSRQTAHNYLNSLTAEGVIKKIGRDNYQIARTHHTFSHAVNGLQEHEVWEKEIQPLLRDLPKNVTDIWHYGCTEMINNVVDHSEGSSVNIVIDRSGLKTEIEVHDNGVGIFRKIAKALNLEDDRHAVLELSKGKVTTDPVNHTGEGIFFSSRAFDDFRIFSGNVFFQHECESEEDWILGEERPPEKVAGTSVFMTLGNASTRQMRDVFDEYATDSEDYRFDRTVVPVKLLQYGDDHLVSRSQAKRLLARFERFRTVVLNFDGVESVGQAFADEVFRVFPSNHPNVEILPVRTNEQVSRMISRATSGREPQADLFTEKPAS